MNIKVGIIGFGRMGRYYLKEFQSNADYDVAYVCDIDEECRALARKMAPEAEIVADEQQIFEDPQVQVVALCAMADSRPEQIRKAVAAGKHIIAEKPLADTIEREWEMVELVEKAPVQSTVNMYLQNAWYHHEMRNAIDRGELGELAIMRICHMNIRRGMLKACACGLGRTRGGYRCTARSTTASSTTSPRASSTASCRRNRRITHTWSSSARRASAA